MTMTGNQRVPGGLTCGNCGGKHRSRLEREACALSDLVDTDLVKTSNT